MNRPHPLRRRMERMLRSALDEPLAIDQLPRQRPVRPTQHDDDLVGR